MRKRIRKLIPIILLLFAAGVVYAYQNPGILSRFKNTNETESESTSNPEIIIKSKDGIGNVLSAATKRVKGTTNNLIKKVTDEQEEALINKTVENLSTQVKDLPKEQAEKIKYQFCQEVVREYEEGKE